MPTSQPRWPWWPWAVLTGAGLTITAVAAIVGTATGNDLDEDEPAPRVTVTMFQTTTVRVTVTVPPPPAHPATALLDGVHHVGVEVEPGIYQTTGPSGTNEGGCYWTRSDSGGALIANGVLTGPGTLTIGLDELVETTGCQPWQKVD